MRPVLVLQENVDDDARLENDGKNVSAESWPGK